MKMNKLITILSIAFLFAINGCKDESASISSIDFSSDSQSSLSINESSLSSESESIGNTSDTQSSEQSSIESSNELSVSSSEETSSDSSNSELISSSESSLESSISEESSSSSSDIEESSSSQCLEEQSSSSVSSESSEESCSESSSSSQSSEEQSSSSSTSSEESSSSSSSEPEIEIIGSKPILSEDRKTIKYGLYPNSYVSDADTISKLSSLTPSNINNWVLYNDEYYVKHTAKVYNSETYEFSNETVITAGSDYWFKCEPVEWKVLASENNSYTLISSLLLDASNFYSSYEDRTISDVTVHPNDYKNSDVAKYLNSTFFNTCFALNSTYINEVALKDVNSSYKVYLPSKNELMNESYGFENKNASTTRAAKVTDYAKADGAWFNDTEGSSYFGNGSYWTRTPSNDFTYAAFAISSSGFVSEYAVDSASHCIRPCIQINL